MNWNVYRTIRNAPREHLGAYCMLTTMTQVTPRNKCEMLFLIPELDGTLLVLLV